MVAPPDGTVFGHHSPSQTKASAVSNYCSHSRRFFAIYLLVGCIFLARWNAKSFLSEPQQFSATGTALTALAVPLVQPELCVDPEEELQHHQQPEEEQDDDKGTIICRCTDPNVPIPGNHVEQWMQYHNQLVQEATNSSSSSLDHDNKDQQLDLVLLGDSLIELWHGTRMMGSTTVPKNRQLFDSLFTRAGGGTLDAIALGTAADKATNLLWHLQNGMLPETLHPKVWLILIGTNDLGFAHCSKQSTLQAILHVTEYLHQQRPGGKILLHGLLPRAEGHGPQARTRLGTIWKRIQWINQQLQQACDERSNWYYMDAATLFLNAEQTQINPQMVADGIHPRLSGMRLWGPFIVKNVHRILSDNEG